MTTRAYKSALKHGLYAAASRKEEIELIGALPILNIEGEIAYERAVIGRIAQVLENNGLAAGSSSGLTEERATPSSCSTRP